MRYDRASVDSSIACARKTAAKYQRITFVYPTAFGFKVDFSKPTWLRAYEVTPQGQVTLKESYQ